MQLYFLTFVARHTPPELRFRERIIYSYLVRSKTFSENVDVGAIHRALGIKHDSIRRGLVALHQHGLADVVGDTILPLEPPQEMVPKFIRNDGITDWWRRLAFTSCEVREGGRTLRQDVASAVMQSLRGSRRSWRSIARQVGVSAHTLRRLDDEQTDEARVEAVVKWRDQTFEEWSANWPHATYDWRRNAYDRAKTRGDLGQTLA